MIISSLQNQRIKSVVKLRNRRDRDREGVLLIEGYRGLLRALQNDYPVTELFICPELYQGTNEDALIAEYADRGCQIVETTASVFQKMAYRDRPEGLLGLGPQQRQSLDNIDLTGVEAPFFMVAEAIEKPGNLGTMLRTADATGVNGLILCDKCTDLFNPNVVRASVGTLFTVDVYEAGSQDAISYLKQNNIKIMAATPHADVLYTDVDLTQPVAIAVGTEQYGLSDQWMDQADLKVRIPMCGQADSLNVATATGLLMYEVVRQRGLRGRIIPDS